MELKLTKTGNVRVIEIHGKFDFDSTEEFEAIFEKQREAAPSVIAINMENLDYIDSSGIGSLIKALNSMKEMGGELVLFGLKKMILNVFKLAKLDLFFLILSQEEFMERYD